MANRPALAPNTFGELMQFCEMLAKSTMIPPAYQRNPANIALAIMHGRETGLGPMQALQNIAVIGGRPSMYGDGQLALVRGSPLCQDVVEHIEGEGDARTAICLAYRKGAAKPIPGKFSVGDAKRAGLWGKAGPWTQYPDRMLQMRARGFALRDAFPDILRGVISAEEAADIPREPKDITPPPQTAAAELDAFAAGNSDLASDQLDVDRLLTDAHSWAQQGIAQFRGWYHQILDDKQRIALRPHIRGLQDTARAVAPNQGEIDMGLATDPVDESPRDQPISEEPGRPEGSLIKVILPAQRPTGRGPDWPRYVQEVIDEARTHDPMHMHEFRVAHAAGLNRLHLADKEEWERVTKILAALERGEDTEDERNLRDDDATTMT